MIEKCPHVEIAELKEKLSEAEHILRRYPEGWLEYQFVLEYKDFKIE